MFIKFEYSKNYSITINKDFVISIECRNVEDEKNNIHEMKFYFVSQQYPEVIYFKNKKSMEKVYDMIFNMSYQDNTLIVIDSKNDIVEPIRLK